MKKRRLFATTLTVLVLVTAIASLVLYKIGDKIFNEVIDGQIYKLESSIEQVDLETQSTEDSYAKAPWGNTPIHNKQPLTEKQTNSNIQQNSNISNPISTQEATFSNQTSTMAQPKEEKIPDMQVTKEKLEDLKQAVTPSDKMTAAAMVLRKLSQSDINTLTKLAANGITAEEKEKMKDIVYARFTQEEIRQIKEMYIKYMGK